jgi:hypothetical protein
MGKNYLQNTPAVFKKISWITILFGIINWMVFFGGSFLIRISNIVAEITKEYFLFSFVISIISIITNIVLFFKGNNLENQVPKIVFSLIIHTVYLTIFIIIFNFAASQ